MKKAGVLKEVRAVKVALAQDEFYHAEGLCNFINEFAIDCVFSVVPESEWPKIYSTVDFRKVKFVQTLAGYLDDGTVQKVNSLAAEVRSRPIDIGYRASQAGRWLGRHGVLKTQIADVFVRKAPEKGLVLDISTRPEDAFLGDGWYRFLLQCKYTIGVEGGSSILDRDGSIRKKAVEYVKRHPDASFKEIEAACFPGLDGSLQCVGVPPRGLEACATRTCQVLVEGEYSGVLSAGKHYIEVKRDFSNIDQVLEVIKKDDQREKITKRAYRDIVESREYTYEIFVQRVLEQSLGDSESMQPSGQASVWNRLIWYWTRLADDISWARVALHAYSVVRIRRSVRKILVNVLSEEHFNAIRSKLH